MIVEPEDVFVPGKFPVDDTNAYADRGEKQRLFTKAVEDGSVPVVFGGYGVGKSSLAHYCVKTWSGSGRLVYVASAHEKTLASIFELVLEKVGYRVEIERYHENERERSSEAGFNLGGGVWGFLKGVITGKISRKQKKRLGDKTQVLIRNPTDHKLIEICEEKGLLLMIDEMHRASKAFIEELSAFLKMYANLQCRRFRVVLLGTEHDARKLVHSDPGVDRVLVEVDLGSMTEGEALDIIKPGFSRLEITMAEKLSKRIARSSAGAPFVVQFLCLEIARMAIQEAERAATDDMLEASLEAYTTTKAKRAIGMYQRAIETTGEIRYRKQVLHAMATIEDEYVTMDQLRDQVCAQTGRDVPSTALSGPLRDLKTDKYGNILCDIDSVSGTGRTYNYSCFTDPAMKCIIRIQIANDTGR